MSTARAISEYVRTILAIFFFTGGTRRYTCFSRYFPNVDEIEKYDWIRGPFDEELTENLSMKEREECAELCMGCTLKLKYTQWLPHLTSFG